MNDSVNDLLSNHLSNVRSFHVTFGCNPPEKPTFPSDELRELNHKMLVDESEELRESETMENALKEVCDILYVALGNGVRWGFTASQINRGLAEVHRSNMTKLWTSDEVANAPRPEDSSAKLVEPWDGDSKWIVRSREGKILKPPGYSPADLSWIEKEEESK